MIKRFKLYESINKEYVVDYHDVPKEVGNALYDIARERGYHNHCYIEVVVGDEAKPEDEVKNLENVLIDYGDGYFYERGDNVIVDWLIDNGAKEGDEVTFKIWW